MGLWELWEGWELWELWEGWELWELWEGWELCEHWEYASLALPRCMFTWLLSLGP